MNKFTKLAGGALGLVLLFGAMSTAQAQGISPAERFASSERSLQAYSVAQLDGLNEVVVSALRMLPTSISEDERVYKLGVTVSEATSIYSSAKRAVGLASEAPITHDSETVIGWTQGTQAIASAKQAGLAPSAIRQLWVVGQFMPGPARMVMIATLRGTDGEWLVIDPRLTGAMTTVQDWYEIVRKQSRDGKVVISASALP